MGFGFHHIHMCEPFEGFGFNTFRHAPVDSDCHEADEPNLPSEDFLASIGLQPRCVRSTCMFKLVQCFQ
jgi:hypothetical protein